MDNNVETVESPDTIDAPVTEAVNSEDVNTETEAVVEESSSPKVEVKDGKTFVDGVRVYSRDETNKIAANAKAQAESKVLQDLDVDNLDQVKNVVSQLRETTDPESPTLDVQSLRDAVKKREASMEELQKEVTQLKTELVLKDHMANLNSAMPSAWDTEQRTAVIDLMKARGMMSIQNDTFVIKNGDEFLTTDGETPDYKGAVDILGKTLGLPTAKKGIDSVSTGKEISGTPTDQGVDQKRLNSDSKYKTAWVQVRKANPSLGFDEVTDGMVKKQMDKSISYDGQSFGARAHGNKLVSSKKSK
tara:strand:- start:2101 stop:3009 length:909 start_codon:yes stop_codon:yes gene_type:complete